MLQTFFALKYAYDFLTKYTNYNIYFGKFDIFFVCAYFCDLGISIYFRCINFRKICAIPLKNYCCRLPCIFSFSSLMICLIYD